MVTQTRDTQGTAGTALAGYCSQCHRTWTLETDSGTCGWCHTLAVRQTSNTPRGFGRSRSRTPLPEHRELGQGYDRLPPGQWALSYQIASKFAKRAKLEDRADLLQSIITTLVDVQRSKPDISEAGLYRVAKLEVAHYWYAQKTLTTGIDCSKCNSGRRKGCRDHDMYRDCPRAVKIESLEKPVIDAEGNLTEIGDLVADDTVLDIDAWLDAQNVVRRLPLRLIDIARQIEAGKVLNNADKLYLGKWRRRLYAQKSLFD